MNRFALPLLLTVCLLLPGPASAAGPAGGLLAWYNFNACDARDNSGGGSDGRLSGSVRCWCGVEGEGLLFDGQSAFVTFAGPVNRAFSTTDFTVSFFLKPEGSSAFPLSLLGKRAACEEEHMLDLLLDFQQEEVRSLVYETTFRYFSGLSPALPPPGWFHYALVREGLYARTYINGQLVQESFLCRGVDISNDALLSFGDSPCVRTGRVRRFRGVLDELRIYERALEHAEIAALYQLTPIEHAQMDCAT